VEGSDEESNRPSRPGLRKLRRKQPAKRALNVSAAKDASWIELQDLILWCSVVSHQTIDYVLDLDLHALDSFHGSCIRLHARAAMENVSNYLLASRGDQESMRKFLRANHRILDEATGAGDRNDLGELLRASGGGI